MGFAGLYIKMHSWQPTWLMHLIFEDIAIFIFINQYNNMT